MSNTIKTLTAGDITREALSILHNKLTFISTINRQYDDRFARSGAKNGGYLEIREPNEFTIRTGAIMDTQDVTEATQQLVLATQLGVDVNFSSVELTLSMDDFKSRILEPAMSRLAAEVEKTTIENVYPYVWKVENTVHGTKPVLADVLSCRALLQQGLAPSSNRYALVDAIAANSIITDSHDIFNPSNEISRQYSEGLIGSVAGITFKESEMTPRHTNGSRTTAGTCDLSALANGSDHLHLTGTSGEIMAKGGVYSVNQETKVSTGQLQQFSVTTAKTMTGSSVVTYVSPIIYMTGAKQNMYCADWTAASAATVVDEATAANSSTGNASTTYTNSLVYHKDAFTFVSADLEMPKGVDFAYRAVNDGISLRIVRNYDIINDKFPCRIDVLFGSKCLRTPWAVRMLS
jgi:hypothetical protein